MVLRVQFMKLNSSYDPCITYCIKFYNNSQRSQLARLACPQAQEILVGRIS